MAKLLPPVPWDKPQNSFEWVDWYTKLRDVIDNSQLDHNLLLNLQGGASGDYRHLTSAQVALVVGSQQTSEKNAANGYAGLNAASRTTRGVDTTDDLIIDTGTKGLVLKNGTTYYRVTVSGAGALVVTNIGTTKP
jgi:hypothetical protein